MKNKMLVLLISCLIISFHCQAQNNSRPKKIKVDGDYIHKETETPFPKEIDEYSRVNVYAFDKKQTDVGVTYENISNKRKTTLSIYLYPAGFGSEDRLRNEYLKCMQSIANVAKHRIHAQQHSVTYSSPGYRIIGFKAWMGDLPDKSSLLIFECGHWFFETRITTSDLDSTQTEKLERRILDFFVPTKLVQKSPLNSKADIYFSKAAFRDSLMLGCVMGSALEKMKWAIANVDSLQRGSGFPGLYLDLHIAGLKGFVNFERDHPGMSRSQPTIDYLNELKSLIDNGFLEEFIMDQFGMIMLLPDNTVLDFSGYEEWKKSNPIKINLNQKYCDIGYK